MRLFFKFLLSGLFVLSPAILTAKSTSEKKCESKCISVEDHFRLLHFFKTPKQYLSFLKNLKLLNPTEFSEMTAELTKLNLLDATLADWPALKSQVIELNGTKIAMLSESEFIIGPNTRFRIDPAQSLKENYLSFFRKINSEKKVSLINFLFLETAWAGPSDQKAQEAALISLTTVTAALTASTEIVGTCLPGLAVSAVGQVAQVIKSIIHPFRRMMYGGNVQCSKGQYFLHQPELVYYDSGAKYKEHYEWVTKYDKDILSKAYGFCYGLVNSGDETVADALSQYKCEKAECIKPIPLSEVSKILNTSPSETPSCNPTIAKKIETFKRKQAEKDEADLLVRISSPPGKARSTPEESNVQ